MNGNSKDGEAEVPRGTLYPHNEIDGFSSGVMLDLRVRLAVGFLNSSPLFYGVGQVFTSPELETLPRACASLSLKLAEELLELASARGWVTPLPEDGVLTPRLRAQAKLSASFQALQQLEAQKFGSAELASAIVPAAAGRRLDS